MMSKAYHLLCALSWLFIACSGDGSRAAKAPPLPMQPPAPAVARTEVSSRDVPPPADVAMEPASPEPLKPAKTAAPGPRTERAVDPWLGNWRCQFDDYPPMRCVVRKTAGGLQIEKTQGSQRIRGTLTPRGELVDFAGEFFCPSGACTSKARAELRQTGRGWAGTILHDQDGYAMRTPLVLTR